MLTAVKVDLGITTDAYDDRLRSYLEFASKAIETEGITVADNIEDGNLVVMYAAWLWRKRAENVPMPRMLRWALNNRLFREKVGADG
jgi:hypothetical protein